ncbi:integrin alpha-11-like [Poecilia latipinna]|nr:PREDICTED: integrin alpha-11-like [Poecilia latipinna]
MLPLIKSTALNKPEDLTHLSQLNSSNSVSIPLHCILSLSPSKALKLTFRGRLHLPTLQAVSFRSLELLTVTTIQLEKTNPMFLQEDILVRQTILDLRKEGPSSIPIWIILGSSLGGLLLLCLVILGLWKLGFFKRRRRQEEEEQPVTNGNAEMQL